MNTMTWGREESNEFQVLQDILSDTMKLFLLQAGKKDIWLQRCVQLPIVVCADADRS